MKICIGQLKKKKFGNTLSERQGEGVNSVSRRTLTMLYFIEDYDTTKASLLIKRERETRVKETKDSHKRIQTSIHSDNSPSSSPSLLFIFRSRIARSETLIFHR